MLHRRGTARQPRAGVVVLFVAVCLVALLGVIAIALDGGQIIHEAEHAQSTADAAALAAASDLYYYTFINRGVDTLGTAAASAKSTAAANGYTSDGVQSVVTPNEIDAQAKPVHGIWIPPISGPYAGKPGYVEVAVQYNQKRSFGSVFGTGTIPVRARAVAVGASLAADAGILVLDPSAKGALSTQGTGTTTVKNTPIIVNSNNPAAAVAGGGGTLNDLDKGFIITGNYSLSGGGTFNGPMYLGRPPTPDPLADLPPPDPTTMTVQSTKKIQQTAGQVTLNPGVYVGGISVSGKASLTMAPGIYYMKGGGFSFSGQGSLYAVGVMVYNAPSSNNNSEGVSVSGQGAITISGPTSGPYQGMAFFQDRNSTCSANITGSGGQTQISGTFYFAGALLAIGGNGGVSNFHSQFISNKLTLGGNGDINVDWDPSLVAQKRSIYLVE